MEEINTYLKRIYTYFKSLAFKLNSLVFTRLIVETLNGRLSIW